MDQTVTDRSAARRSKRRRALFAVLLGASFATLGAGAMSLAIFTDSDAANGSWTSGTIILGVTTTTAFTATDILPGDTGNQTVHVNNTGTGALRYAMTSAADNTDGKDLRSQLTLTIQAGTCAAPGATLYSGALNGALARQPRPGRRHRRPQRRRPAARTTCASAGRSTSTPDNAYQAAATTAVVHLRRRADRQQPVTTPAASPGPPPAGRGRGSPFPDKTGRAAPDRLTGSPDMPLVAVVTRAARKTLDILLLLLIVGVLGIVVLARILPTVTGGTTFVVGGPSMNPTIPLGSAVHAVPVSPDQLQAGDIVSLQAGLKHAVFTHRITRVVQLPDGLYIETKGDANDAPDPSLVPVKDVIGKVTVAVPFAGFGIALLSSYQGVMFLIAFGMVLLASAWLLETLEDEQQESMRRRARQALAAFAPGAERAPGRRLNVARA